MQGSCVRRAGPWGLDHCELRVGYRRTWHEQLLNFQAPALLGLPGVPTVQVSVFTPLWASASPCACVERTPN